MTALDVMRAGHVWRAVLVGTAPNSVDETLLTDLTRLLDDAAADPDVRAVVITGHGSTFCVGLDLEVLGRGFADHAYLLDMLGRYQALLTRMERLPVAFVAALNGTTRAGGLELMLACDVVVAADEARIADHHLHSGILPGGGASARLPRLIGPRRARELLLTARWLTGQEAVSYGLASRSVPAADLDDAAAELAAVLAEKPRHAIGALKELLADGSGLGLGDACALELAHFERYLAQEPLAGEGYQAYVENREMVWRTR